VDQSKEREVRGSVMGELNRVLCEEVTGDICRNNKIKITK
jgi:hypothetical protein